MFKVTKLFIGGILEGLTHTEITSVAWIVGQEVTNPIGGSPYRIIAVELIG